jgi:DNA polymerase II small subunit/DNA polymerase delta subunit B
MRRIAMKKEINLGELQDLLAEGPGGREKIRKQAAAISALQESLMATYKRQKPYEVPVKSDENIIRFGLIGDTQIGSLYQNRDGLKAYYKQCHEEGVDDILHGGDVLDGWRVYRGQEFELRPDGKSWPEQKNLFVEEMPKHEGMRTIFITGNHDASFKNLVGMVVGDELSAARPDWKFIGQDVGDVTLKTKQGQTFRVRLIHPGGGTAYAVSYHAQKIIESMPGGEKPDLLGIAHYHKAMFMPAYRNVECIEVGCFQWQTPFMIRFSIAAHVGGWIITVHLNERKKLTSRVQAEFVGFYAEQR